MTTKTPFFYRSMRVQHEDGDRGTVEEVTDEFVAVKFDSQDERDVPMQFSRVDPGLFDLPAGPLGVSRIAAIPHTAACLKYRQNSRYNPSGTKGCPACDDKAEQICKKAPDCPTNPYDPYCGHAFGKGSCGQCGRQSDTN